MVSDAELKALLRNNTPTQTYVTTPQERQNEQRISLYEMNVENSAGINEQSKQNIKIEMIREKLRL